jgi:cyclopropane fatty-acyl-phospholipid synthase-like methyltransferase
MRSKLTQFRSWISRLLPRREERRWERNWSRSPRHHWELEAVSRHFVDALEAGWMKPGDRCLDVGCGLGHSAAWLASRGLRVTGVDIAESAIRSATMLHAATPGLAFRTLDVTAPCDDLGPFEAIVDRGCLHVIPLPGRPVYFANVARWLAPGGVFLVQHRAVKHPPERVREQLRRKLSPGLEIIHDRPIDMLEEAGPGEGIPGVLVVARRVGGPDGRRA